MDQEYTGQQTGITITEKDESGLLIGDPKLVAAALPGPLGSAAATFNSTKAALADGQVSGGEIAGIASGAAGFVSSCLEATSIATDPVGWLVGQGLNFLLSVVQPLQDAIHLVSGDGPALVTAAANFNAIAKGLSDYSTKFVAEAQQSLAEWKGQAADTAATKLAQFGHGIEGVAAQSGDIAQLLQISGMVMQVIEEFLKAVLTELITWLIMIWIPALAAAVPTFGASTAAAGAATGVRAAQTTSKVARYVQKLRELLGEIQAFLAKLKDFFGKWKGDFAQIMDTKAMQSGLAKLETESAKEAGRGTSLTTKMMHPDDGVIGTRVSTGAADSFDAAWKKGALSQAGLGKLVGKDGGLQVPDSAKDWGQLGADVASKAAKYGSGIDKGVTYGETGGGQEPEQTPGEIADNLDF